MPAHWWKGNLPFQSQVPPESYSEDQTLCYKCLPSTKEWTHMPAFLSCMTLNLWMALPFMIMMIDGALSSIDRSYYESAELDGAGFWSKNIHITVPAMKGIIAPAVIMTTFTTFKQFDIVYLLTMQKGAYSGATLQTIITYAQQNAFVSNNYGLSFAVSIIIFFLIMVFSLFTNRGVKEENYD